MSGLRISPKLGSVPFSNKALKGSKPNGLGTMTYYAPANMVFDKVANQLGQLPVAETRRAALGADGTSVVDNYRSSLRLGSNVFDWVQKCDQHMIETSAVKEESSTGEEEGGEESSTGDDEEEEQHPSSLLRRTSGSNLTMTEDEPEPDDDEPDADGEEESEEAEEDAEEGAASGDNDNDADHLVDRFKSRGVDEEVLITRLRQRLLKLEPLADVDKLTTVQGLRDAIQLRKPGAGNI